MINLLSNLQLWKLISLQLSNMILKNECITKTLKHLNIDFKKESSAEAGVSGTEW